MNAFAPRRSAGRPHEHPTRAMPEENPMRTTSHTRLLRTLASAGAALVLSSCADEAPLAPEPDLSQVPALEARAPKPGLLRALTEMARATARYHRLDAAIADGFVFLHGCESRPDEGPVGMVYVHMGRLTDGVIDPSAPDALVYEPRKRGRPKLVGVELAVPYGSPGEAPPEFFGVPFQPEDEFGVWGLHVWLWRFNPEGLFAESNPRVSCVPAA